MRATYVADLTSSPVAVLTRLADPSAWPSFVGGLSVASITPDLRVPDRCEVEISFVDPRPFRLRVQVGRHAGGVSILMVHGDLSGVDLRVEVAPSGNGSTVHAALELLPSQPLPGAFRAELETALLPRWFAALEAGLRAA